MTSIITPLSVFNAKNLEIYYKISDTPPSENLYYGTINNILTTSNSPKIINGAIQAEMLFAKKSNSCDATSTDIDDLRKTGAYYIFNANKSNTLGTFPKINEWYHLLSLNEGDAEVNSRLQILTEHAHDMSGIWFRLHSQLSPNVGKWGDWRRIINQTDFTYNMNLNGYIKFASYISGLIIQWGSILFNNSPTNVSLPINFSSASYRLALAVIDSANDVQSTVQIKTKTNSQFSFNAWRNGNISATNMVSIDWIAIGF